MNSVAWMETEFSSNRGRLEGAVELPGIATLRLDEVEIWILSFFGVAAGGYSSGK
jgi:hypothetical protein